MGQFKQQKIPEGMGRILEVLGIDAGDDQVEKLAIYAEEILCWNRRVNLTGAKTVEAFVAGPLFDALTLIPVLEKSVCLVDIGSGGGLPGVPAALLGDVQTVTLVEPRKKRVAFLHHIVQRLDLRGEVVEGRNTGLSPGTWDAAVAQAVWPAPTWVQHAVRLVKRGGAIYSLTSTPLAPGDLPAGATIEQQLHWSRPIDHAERWTARIRRG